MIGLLVSMHKKIVKKIALMIILHTGAGIISSQKQMQLTSPNRCKPYWMLSRTSNQWIMDSSNYTEA